MKCTPGLYSLIFIAILFHALPARAATNRVTMESMTVLQDTITANLKVSGVLAFQLLPDEGEDEKATKRKPAVALQRPHPQQACWDSR